MTRKSNINVPDGYFQDLQERLLSIPETQAPRRVHLAPYFAYAASLVALVLAGTFILQKTAVPQGDAESQEEWSYVSYLAQSLDPDCATYQWREDSPSSEDVINYLVNDGLTLEELVSYEEDY